MTAANSSPSKPNNATDSSPLPASNHDSASITTDPQGDADVRPRATDSDWPMQKRPPQRRAETHDDNVLETLGKAIIAPIQDAVEGEDLPDKSKMPSARPTS